VSNKGGTIRHPRKELDTVTQEEDRAHDALDEKLAEQSPQRAAGSASGMTHISEPAAAEGRRLGHLAAGTVATMRRWFGIGSGDSANP
jgi:hypothetical protein